MKADEWRTKLAKKAIDQLIPELQKIDDKKLEEATYRNIKLKINIK